VSGGEVTGYVRIVMDPHEAASVQPGEILVVPCSQPEYALGVMQAAGLICEKGGVISHICTVALELGIPCVTEVTGVTSLLTTSQRVTIHGDRGLIYAD
jgi:phosphohistidine swiveling domain-containing protein